MSKISNVSLSNRVQWTIQTTSPRKSGTYRGGLVGAVLQNLNHALFLLGGTKLALESSLAGSVEDTLGTVAA